MPKNRKVKINETEISLPQTRGEVLFWKFINQGLNKKDAYIKAYPNSDPKYASIYASRLYNKKKFEPIRKSLWEQFKDDAIEAYQIQKDILKDNRNEPDLRNKIADKILDRAGFSPVAKTAQLKMTKDMDNPLLEKSEEELMALSEKTATELKEIKKELLKLNTGKGREIIDGDFTDEK